MLKRVIGVVVSITILCGIYFVATTHFKKNKKQKTVQPTLVKLSKARVQDVPITVKATGNLVANDKTILSPKVGGYITQINFNEGQLIKAGTVLIHLDDSKQKQQLLSSEAAESLAKATYQRYLTLSKKHITSPQDIDKYRSDYKKAVALVEGDKASLNDTVLRAPIAGYLGAKTISLGDYVNPGQSLVQITDTKTLRINYSVPSRFSPKLKLGQEVKVTADFLPGKQFIGKVSYIAPNVDPVTQTIEVHAVLENQNQLLKPGQSVDVTQALGSKKNALLIPASSMIANINGNYVYIVKNNKIVSVPVKIGEHYKQDVIVMKGLTAGQKLVTEGQFQVKNGAIVKVVS